MHLLVTERNPLDVAYFGPMKREWRKTPGRWRTIPESRLGIVINELMKPMAPNTRRILMSGFRKCRIVPWNCLELTSQLPTKIANIDLVGNSFKDFQLGLNLKRSWKYLLEKVFYPTIFLKKTPKAEKKSLETGQEAQNWVNQWYTSTSTGIHLKNAC